MNTNAKKTGTYADLLQFPEGTRAELIDGEVEVSPRPNHGHRAVERRLSAKLFESSDGKGLKSGWLIENEPEVKFGENIFIPDLAGWRLERIPELDPMASLVTVIPDWTCEILSPSSAKMDRVRKYSIYLTTGVQFYWIIDPINKTIEAFKNGKAQWTRIGAWAENDKARIAPFEEIEIDLDTLWLK